MVMHPAKRDGELVVHLAAKSPLLGEAQVVES